MLLKQFNIKILELLEKADTEDIDMIREVIVELLCQQLLDENENYSETISAIRRKKLYAY